MGCVLVEGRKQKEGKPQVGGSRRVRERTKVELFVGRRKECGSTTSICKGEKERGRERTNRVMFTVEAQLFLVHID